MGDLGPWLVHAREARGLTLEDAERDTRISRRYLQALENEEFDVIPAPVYARGFLRSYSQYLGLDPQEAMARYPREEDPGYTAPSLPHPRAGAPASRGGASPFGPPQSSAGNRPAWRRPRPGEAPGASPGPAPGGATRRGAGGTTRPREEPHEPTIGIDIGVPVPARRLQPDPAAQTRTVVVAVVAVIAIAIVLFFAFVISQLGDDSPPEGLGLPSDTPGATGSTPTSEATNDAGVAPSGLDTTPGVVPDVEGQPMEVAAAAIREAGFEPNVTTAQDDAPAGTVLTQSPGPGIEQAPGGKVTIVVSEGPQ